MKSNTIISKVSQRQKVGLNIHDILFVLFKHKWKIIVLAILGCIGSGGLLYRAMIYPSYETRAKLLVRYIIERSTVDPYEAKVDAGGSRGIAVMDAEIEIIKSTDLALIVADQIGLEKFVSSNGKLPNRAEAAIEIIKNLDITAVRGSNVIHIAYRNKNPDLAVNVMNQLIETYFEKHLAIHRSTGAFENVARQTDQARSRLSQTEDELNKLNNKSGIMSLAESRGSLESRRNTLRENLLDAQVELAEQQVRVSALEASVGIVYEEPANISPDRSYASNPTGEVQEDRMTYVRIQQQLRDLTDQLGLFKQRRNELMMSRKPGDRMIVALDSQIEVLQQQTLSIMEQYPKIASQTRTQDESSSRVYMYDLNKEKAILASSEAKVKALAGQVAAIDSEVDHIATISVGLTNLERRRQLEEEKYKYFETSLEKARVDEALDPASMPNIGMVQEPSIPIKSITNSTKRHVMGLAASGLISGLCLAFLIEWVLDRRISRPTEIHTRLQLPLMLSIPCIRSKDGLAKLIGREPGSELVGTAENLMSPPNPPDGSGQLSILDGEHFISPYAGAIRDRIMFGFELNNITHKPKLIALTGLSSGSGTSTIAAGLAKAFAENGNQKVLLVDLNPSKSGFMMPEHSSESLGSVLDVSKTALFRTNSKRLYLASAPTRRNGKGTPLLASAALHEMLPRLETCDFDYVIFDMPALGPTSPTLAIAGFMDKVLLVLDADNTNRESLSWSYAELEKGRADVSCIFNKAKSHAPRWVSGEL